jgi:hypothetical protein
VSLVVSDNLSKRIENNGKPNVEAHASWAFGPPDAATLLKWPALSVGVSGLAGDFRSGLALHEDRWRARSAKQMLTAVPRLGPSGDQDLNGKRLAIFSEQGLGDSIQFIRFARDLSAAGAQVTAIVHAPLVSLFRSSRLAHAVVDIDTALTPFDFACPLMSLPALLGTDLESLARDPRYLQADPAKTRSWQQRLGENQKSCRAKM